MSSIIIGTGDLLRLLGALECTAVQDEEGNGTDWPGILLHCTRDPDAPPGQREILVGTAGDGWLLGHFFVRCQGQLTRPTLWGIADVDALVSAFKPKLKGNKLHTVEVALDGDQVTISEDDNLAAAGLRLQFTAKSLARYPRNAWQLLGEAPIDPRPRDRRTGDPVPVEARTDVSPAALAAFGKAAKIIGAPVELYRYHQRLPVLVQIGYAYRGLFTPSSYEEGADRGKYPHATVHDPGLPPKPPEEPSATGALAGTTVTIVRNGHPDVALSEPGDVVEGAEPIADFPAVTADYGPLCEAATIVIETQFAGASLLAKTMRIGFPRAQALLEQLEQRDVVGPKQGSRSRRVLVAPVDLDAVLAAIRGPQPTEPTPEEATS
ncbi:DNA translocase FtsK [Amycolatopsis tolypomycina]|uniref:DNA translocase FtsK n=1 Tax=Amycolatopsis tolypomycina TaxID=208445 RepID=UPI0033B9C0D7